MQSQCIGKVLKSMFFLFREKKYFSWNLTFFRTQCAFFEKKNSQSKTIKRKIFRLTQEIFIDYYVTSIW